MSSIPKAVARCVAAVGAFSALAALAQTPAPAPAKPPPKPAAAASQPAAANAAASAPRGFGNARGALLTRDELRACFNQEAELKKRLEATEATRVPLEAEKKAIGEEQAAMRGERDKLDPSELNAAVKAFTERHQAFTERRAKWEARVKAFNEAGRRGSDQERDALNAERAELEREHVALEEERKRLLATQSAREQAAAAFNAKVAALDAKVADWNKRNVAYNEGAAALESDRQAWVGNCGNRRYREEDEQAIRAGK